MTNILVHVLVLSLALSHLPAAAVAQPTGDAAFAQAMELERRGTPEDLRRAGQLYEDAAKQGHVGARERLAYFLYVGAGVPRDVTRATALLAEVAKDGRQDSQYLLAMLTLNADPPGAREHLARAANGGHQHAQFALAQMLWEGIGGTSNKIAAGRWFERASQGADRELAAKARKLRDQAQEYANTGGALGFVGALKILAGIYVGAAVVGSLLADQNGANRTQGDREDSDWARRTKVVNFCVAQSLGRQDILGRYLSCMAQNAF